MKKFLIVIFMLFLTPALAQIKRSDIKMGEDVSSNRIPNNHFKAIFIARKHLTDQNINPDQFDVFVSGRSNIVAVEFNYRTDPGSSIWRATQKGCPREGRPACREYVVDIQKMEIIRYRDVPF